MVIIHPNKKFAIHWEILEVTESWIYGSIIMVIDGYTFPNKIDCDYTLGVVFSNLKESFKSLYYPAGKLSFELGNRKVNFKKLDYGEEPDLFDLETTELGYFYQNDDRGGLRISIGYSGNSERIFVSSNNGESYKEFIFPKGTFEYVINQLPDYEQLRSLAIKNT